MKEIWKSIVGFEGFYEVSSYGNIRSMDRKIKDIKKTVNLKGKNMKLSISTSHGYLTVALWKEGIGITKLVHRLVAEAFFGSSTLSVNHKNFNRLDNHIENLEYLSLAENNYHAWINGHVVNPLGSENGKSKLKEHDILKIRKLRQQGKTMPYIAQQFNVSSGAIQAVLEKRTWAHI